MKKIMIILSMALMMLGCGGSSNSIEPTATPVPTEGKVAVPTATPTTTSEIPSPNIGESSKVPPAIPQI